ncbi:MAG: adenylate/guanylate cyclase domain-containing protein, partial [Elusimicrobia bacterium]|nr:adenylate/guanylate cyclase domain-containing protein [Elusimicrobiota bacterium]
AAGQEVYQLAGVAVNAPDLIGGLIAAFKLDDRFAASISSQTKASVSFATEAGLFASTLDAGRRGLLERRRAAVPLGRPALIGEPGAQELAMAIPVARGVHAYLQLSWDEAIEPLRRLQRALGLLAAVALALTAVVGFFIADSVTASMRELAEATGKISGGDFSARVAVRTRDEVGRLGAAFNAMVAGLQEREKIRSVLRKTVSKEIADELLKRGQINLGGEERLVTVLFSDIRSFTTISEDLDPPTLVSELNEYFGKMARAIEERRGVIDKFIGDAIMALFGAPVGSPDDAANALRAALAMRGALEELNAQRAARGLARWETGIGLNTGTAVAGTLGSESRLSYTVIGDAVNLASRLEGLTKHYGCPILLSAGAREKAGPGFAYRSIDLVRVKGRHHTVEIFELLGEAGAPPAWLGGWEKAVAAYRSGALAEARRLFEATAAARPGDGAAAEYLRRLATLPEQAAAGWDPAHTALEK